MWPADARAFSRPTSKAREKRPGDEVGGFFFRPRRIRGQQKRMKERDQHPAILLKEPSREINRFIFNKRRDLFYFTALIRSQVHNWHSDLTILSFPTDAAPWFL